MRMMFSIWAMIEREGERTRSEKIKLNSSMDGARRMYCICGLNPFNSPAAAATTTIIFLSKCKANYYFYLHLAEVLWL